MDQLDITDCSYSKRSFLGWMVKENKKKIYPTNNDIVKIRTISPDHTKRITGQYKKEGLINVIVYSPFEKTNQLLYTQNFSHKQYYIDGYWDLV